MFYYSLPIFVAPISNELGWDRELIFWGLSFALLTSVVMAPFAGRQIDRGKAKRVLIVGQLIGAASLLLIGAVHSPWAFLLLCCGIGVCQASCLYETAFSLLHRQLGAGAPRAIIRLTLVAGFAGTVFVPGAQLLTDALGWRTAAAALACVGLVPAILYAVLIPSDGRATDREAPEVGTGSGFKGNARLVLMIAAFGASAAIFSIVTIHFVPLMIDRGMSGIAAAQVFALVGPAQVASRVIIWLFPTRLPALSRGGAAFLMQAGSVLLLAVGGTGFSLLAFALVFGASSGLMTIIRGTAPAELCGRDVIGRVNGAIGAVSGLSRALAPALFALTAGHAGRGPALLLVFALSLAGAAAFVIASAGSRRRPVR